MFVFMGSFQSFPCNAATTDYAAVKAGFTALAQLICEFERIAVSFYRCTIYLHMLFLCMIVCQEECCLEPRTFEEVCYVYRHNRPATPSSTCWRLEGCSCCL